MIDLHGFGGVLLQGTIVTVKLAVTSLFFGLIFGMLGAMGKLSNVWIFRKWAMLYTTLVRGIPELLYVLFMYFGVQIVLLWILPKIGYTKHVNINEFWIGVVALSTMFGAYATEVFRMAIQEIPKGQWEASQVMGMRPFQTFWRIILPQVWLVALPGLGNLFLVLMKDTALISVIGLKDIMYYAGRAGQTTQQPFTFFMVAALIYLGLTVVITLCISWGEWISNPAQRYAKKMRKQKRADITGGVA
ncbi:MULTISPECIES: ABC transporter permease [unclassified Acinetobacter]|uniref:ABC transporter permease n=1 Tax=unclassified Acinetobacter TaxID=196816 RepID=UPI0035B7DEAE